MIRKLSFGVLFFGGLLGGCGPSERPEVRYVALGDSFTGTLLTDTYPHFLIEQLGIDQGEFAAEGDGGRTAVEAVEDFDELIEEGLYPNANVLIYFLGGADVITFVAATDPGLAFSPSDDDYPFPLFLEALLAVVRQSIRQTLLQAGQEDLEIYIATYPALPAGKSPCPQFGGIVPGEIEAARANEYVKLLNDIIADLAEELDVKLVDLRLDNAELTGDLENYTDCVHPSASGAEIIAGRFAVVLGE